MDRPEPKPPVGAADGARPSHGAACFFITVVPITPCLLPRRTANSRRPRLVLIGTVALASLLFAGLVVLAIEMFLQARQWELDAIARDFQRQAADAAVIMSDSFTQFSSGAWPPWCRPDVRIVPTCVLHYAGQQQTALSLYGPRGWGTTRRDFVAVTTYIMAKFPNTAGCFLSLWVNGTDRAPYEAFSDSQGGACPASPVASHISTNLFVAPAYTGSPIMDLNGPVRSAAGNRSEYWPILYYQDKPGSVAVRGLWEGVDLANVPYAHYSAPCKTATECFFSFLVVCFAVR